MRFTFSLVLALLPLAYAQTPFPIAFKTGNAAQASSASSLASSYALSVEQQPAFTTFAASMAQATGLTENEQVAFNNADNNPILLANAFFTATATPAWYTEVPSNLQSYVSSIANAEASIVAQVLGDAPRLGSKVAVVGGLLTTMLVAILML